MTAWDNFKNTSLSFSGTAMSVRCYESHPVLTLGKGKLYGGSAHSPVIKTADIYVVLQSGDAGYRQTDPWDKDTQKIIEVYYGIQDMGAPTHVARFKKMVTWLCTQLQRGKVIHVGCIGGHGRTGLVLSAIVAEMLSEQDAIGWVRKHYCKKAVESSEQVSFLKKHYGVTAVRPTKIPAPKEEPTSGSTTWETLGTLSSKPLVRRESREIPEMAKKATRSFDPVASARSLWKPKKK